MSVQYWQELRAAVLRTGIVFVVVFGLCCAYSEALYHILQRPILAVLPSHHLIVTSLTATVLMPLKLGGWAAVCVAMPYGFYECWRFITPALTGSERIWIGPLVGLSAVLFICGGLFAYWCVFPLMFKVFVQWAPQDVKVLPDMMGYLELCGTWVVSFGLAAQLPLMMCVLTACRIVSAALWVQYRPHAVVGAFVMGMLLTPPDVISQLLLALPLCVLYQLGYMLAGACERHRRGKPGKPAPVR